MRESAEVLMKSKTIHFGILSITFKGGEWAAAAINSKWRHSPDYSNEVQIHCQRFLRHIDVPWTLTRVSLRQW